MKTWFLMLIMFATPVYAEMWKCVDQDGNTRYTNETQKQRDAGRRKILDQELVQEQQQLEAAKKQLVEQQDIRLGSERNPVRMQERLRPYADRVRLHENNIESLKKEIANVR